MLVCGIDLGTTNLKVALFDEAGRMVWIRSVPTPRVEDGSGSATDVRRLLDIVEDLLIEGWRSCGQGAPVLAISTTGVGEDGLYCGKDLEPLAYAIPWFDQRAAGEARELALSGSATPLSGLAMEPTRAAPRWLWTARHQPELLDASDIWISLTDYPLAKWSEAPFMSDTLASRTGCFNSMIRAWIEPLLRESHAPRLPPVLRAGATVGTMKCRRLLSSGACNEDTLLVAGGHDHPVAAHAIHKLSADARVDSLGTANVIYGDAPQFQITSFDPEIAIMASIEGPSKLACLGVFEFTHTVMKFRGGMDAIRRELALDQISGEPGDASPQAFHTERQLLEWATFNARSMLERLHDFGVPEGPIYATGGWSRSRALLELRASIFGREVHAPEERELSVLGAAVFAAEAIGRIMPLEPAVQVIQPNLDWAGRYQDLYSAFKERRS